MKPQSIAYLLNGNAHIYWILNFEGEVHSIWDLWVSDRHARAMSFFEIERAGNNFPWGP